MADSSASDSDRIALLIVCRECDHENWIGGPRFPTLVDYVTSSFECEGCGRQLETGNDRQLSTDR